LPYRELLAFFALDPANFALLPMALHALLSALPAHLSADEAARVRKRR
jgi:hypothetical protein